MNSEQDIQDTEIRKIALPIPFILYILLKTLLSVSAVNHIDWTSDLLDELTAFPTTTK